jgi:DNA-binding MarR family transcriptional regulator/ribosomal protein S18 acetylase RimI-like enzyme
MDENQIAQIRSFNRFYTSVIGLLDKNYLNSEFSLTEVRILYELYHHPDGISASELISLLNLDKGYLSRMLDQFEKAKLVEKRQSAVDKRSSNLFLTGSGKEIFERLNAASSEQIRHLLSSQDERDIAKLVHHMNAITQIMQQRVINLDDITIRTELRPGDIGYITYMHGELYKTEYNYGITFETYVASGFEEFYKNYDPDKDRVWIAEHNNRIVGFLLLINRENDTAQLRFFLLDPAYRGVGLGKKMVRLFMQFFKDAGYKHCYLLTTSEQIEAANIYVKLGFKLTKEKDSAIFGKPLKEQRYDLE